MGAHILDKMTQSEKDQSDKELDGLRQEINRIDQSIHDLLMRRTEVAAEIGKVKGATGTFLRPGREAIVLRRLVERHRGKFPASSLVRIWREIMGSLVCLQGPFAVAVFMPDQRRGYWNLARDHFGTSAPMTGYGAIGQVLAAVGDDPAAVGILPWPHENHTDPWWRQLMSRDAQAPRVIARLPFTAGSQAREDALQAVVIGRFPAEETGNDRSLLAIETEVRMSRDLLRKLLGEIGQNLNSVAVWRDELRADVDIHLVEVDGVFSAEDATLANLARDSDEKVLRITVLGGYAVPMAASELGGDGRDKK